MDENETNQNDVTPEIDSNRGPSALDMPATNSDDEEEQAIWFYEENQEDETDLEPNAALVVVTGTDELKGSFMFNVKVGPNGELPYRKEGHYPEHLVERELPLRQPDGSINIGFSPKAECDLNVPGVIVYQYLDANQKVVANAIVVVWIVAGLDRPIVRRVAQDLLEKQTTMSIQHGQAYVACAARGEVLQLEVPHHSGYAEDQNRYGTGEPVGQLQIDHPNPPHNSDNALRYWVLSNAPEGSDGAIEDDFVSSSTDNIVDAPTVVVVFPEDVPESSLYRIAWERLLT